MLELGAADAAGARAPINEDAATSRSMRRALVHGEYGFEIFTLFNPFVDQLATAIKSDSLPFVKTERSQ
jgi:hypothetical protein